MLHFKVHHNSETEVFYENVGAQCSYVSSPMSNIQENTPQYSQTLVNNVEERRLNMHTPMAKAASQNQITSMMDEVKNKKARKLKSVYVRPVPSLVCATFNFILLRNGGMLHRVQIPRIGGKAMVRMHSTCTLDNILMMLGISYVTDADFKSKLNEQNFKESDVMQFCRSYEMATSQTELQLARFNIIKNNETLWNKKAIIQESARKVYCSLHDNESDMVNLLFGKYQKYVVRGRCCNNGCRRINHFLTRTRLDVRMQYKYY